MAGAWLPESDTDTIGHARSAEQFSGTFIPKKMKRTFSGLAFGAGWLIAYVGLIVAGDYPSPLWGGEGLLSAVFVMLSCLPGIVMAILVSQRVSWAVLAVVGAIGVSLLALVAKLVTHVLDVLGAKEYLSWLVAFAFIEGMLLLVLALAIQKLRTWFLTLRHGSAG